MFVRGTVGRAVSDRASRGHDGRHRYCGLVTRETLSRQLKQSDGGLKACSAVRKLTPSSEQLVIRYSGGANRFRFTASRVLELSKGDGWTSHSPIEGRIVLLGGSFGTGDRHETPLGTMMGVEILANTIETELSGGGHQPPSTIVLILLLAFEGIWTVLIFHKFESKLIKPLILTLPVVVILSLLCSLLIYQSLAQLPYFLFMLLAIVIYQSFEAFRHKTIIDTYDQATELRQDANKRAE